MYVVARGRSIPRRLSPPLRRGLGDAITTTGSLATAGVTTAAGIMAGLAPHLVILGMTVPVVGAIIAGVITIGVLIAEQFKGCGQTCIEATKIANQVAPLLQQNLDHYMSQPVHYRSVQTASLTVFDTTWQALVQACGQPQLQAAGERCISDRQQGACHWKASPGGWSQDASGAWHYSGFGPAGSGDACVNWFLLYRDPIANDPTVVDDAAGAGVLSAFGLSPSTTVFGLPLSRLLLPAGLIGLALLMPGGKK